MIGGALNTKIIIFMNIIQARLHQLPDIAPKVCYCSGYEYVFGYAIIDPLPVWRDWSLINELSIN